MKLALTLSLIVFGIITCINPIYPNDQLLQHIGTLLLLVILVADLRKKQLRMSSFLSVWIFAIIHIIGARYIYSNVPYNDWAVNYLGVNLNEYFETTRNHYDRFVHLAFGVLAFPYLYQVTAAGSKLKKPLKLLLVWSLIQAGSMFYELFEWGLTLVMSGEAADHYNGQQGDMWDAQKDMVLAMLGSSVMVIICIFIPNRENENFDANTMAKKKV